MKSRHAQQGATLMEMLVVMSVVAVLSSMLYPAFVQVKEKAKQTVCIYNQQQLGAALSQYIQDNDEGLPTAANWAYGLYPYVNQPRMYLCPDYTGTKKIAFAMNSFLDTKPTSDVKLSSSVVALFETSSPAGDNPDPSMVGDKDPNGIWVGFDATEGNHGSLYRHTSLEAKSKGADPRLNYIFVDGHAKFIPYSHVEDLTAENNGLHPSADYKIGTFKKTAYVTFNYLAER